MRNCNWLIYRGIQSHCDHVSRWKWSFRMFENHMGWWWLREQVEMVALHAYVKTTWAGFVWLTPDVIDSSQNLLHLAGIPLMTHAEWSGGSIFAKVGPGGFLVLRFLSLDDGLLLQWCRAWRWRLATAPSKKNTQHLLKQQIALGSLCYQNNSN